MKYLKQILNIVVSNIRWILLGIIVVLIIVNIKSCTNIVKIRDDNKRLSNNILAVQDTLRNYRDGVYNVAEMRALQLRSDELADSLRMERGRTPITISQYSINITDTIYTPVETIRDTIYLSNTSDRGVLQVCDSNDFGNSNRVLRVDIPYTIDQNGKINTIHSSIYLDQNIWIENILYRDRKGYTYLKIRTDYPGVIFNSGSAIIVSNPKDDYKKRKSFGVNLGVQLGYGCTINKTPSLVPYIGLGVGFGWNPRFLQF